jgi:hypothetical protein
MRAIFDFKCSEGHITEKYADGDSTIDCDCGEQAKRIISPVRCKLEGVSGDFPSAAMQWTKRHEGLGGYSNDE